jgi:hypothetical protein
MLKVVRLTIRKLMKLVVSIEFGGLEAAGCIHWSLEEILAWQLAGWMAAGWLLDGCPGAGWLTE